MKNIPNKIYLNMGNEPLEVDDDFKDWEVSWCEDKD